MLTASVTLFIFLIILIAGCTNPPGPGPVTPVTTPAKGTVNQTPVPAVVADPALSGTWYLKMIGENNGTAPVDTMSPQITAVFTNQSNIIGFSGCNNYNGHYTLTGQVFPEGKGISVGPIASSTMYCANTSGTEMTYIQVLQDAKTYSVNVDRELTITDNSGNALVYQNTPYSATFVPKGF